MLATIAVYWPVTGFDFINYDDPTFVSANLHVQGGLNWEGVRWAFGLKEEDYWHPLTWLSLMLDASLFGQGAGGFHFTNAAFHAVNSVLLFLLLRRLTGALWRSAVVAALFALHPLRVESVAWVTERKDVLSGCFGLLALTCYGRYAQRSVIGNQLSVISDPSPRAAARGDQPQTAGHRLLITDHRLLFYFLSLGFFACGLMSKAILVTWPFVMLLLDYWPLGRMQRSEVRGQRPEDSGTQHATRNTLHAPLSTLLPLVREKIPFFVLSGLWCVLTYFAEVGRPEAAGFEASSALVRLQNAVVACALYLGKTFWPVNLAMPYMNPGHWPWLQVAGAVLVVGGAGVAALWQGWRRPSLLVGWCWFCGMLIPVIGLTKGWGSFMADRFTYLPSIGLLILTVWGVYELIQGKAEIRGRKSEAGDPQHAARTRVQSPILLWVAGGAAIGLCVALTRQQLGCWKDSETLFRHALTVTENNDIAHNNLGVTLDAKGQITEAITQLREAIRLKPNHDEAHYNLGIALGRKGQIDEAITEFREAIRLLPYHVEAHYNLGNALYQKGQIDEAIRHFQDALRLKPEYADAHCNLGVAFFQQGRTTEAIQQFQEALRLKPDFAGARNNLSRALAAPANPAPPPGATTNR